MLYQLSYAGQEMERETGIEPATNSLEGCDSTIELLPRTSSLYGIACSNAKLPARLARIVKETSRPQ